ncbi:MAG: hypothetical protein OXF73_07650 [Gammaproteobacteria bacterium]|nr:hypothetical protein [Gammaproteobacteria bacterium]MCY4228108.1 hypothetical protein [Gammaproteobacteria bacterium]
MSAQIVDVLANGTVCLGPEVVCDGFASGYPYRVQTHIHDDHMRGFDTSKGLQDLLMSHETYDLLVAELNADLEYRDNLHPIHRGAEHTLKSGSKLFLLPSNHMLGSCQVMLTKPDGLKIGYSGDFGWPLDQVIKVDELVVDSTYGGPNSVRNYTQEEAEECLLSTVCERLPHGSVHIRAYRGTIERVLQVLYGSVNVPILASTRLIREVGVYQKYGFAIGELYTLDSDVGRSAIKERSYIRLYSKGDGFGNELIEGTTITCSAFMVDSNRPRKAYSERAYSVALSNHADFDGTLAYIESTGARRVITNNTQNHGWELAIAINNHLSGVHAQPSTNNLGPRWG